MTRGYNIAFPGLRFTSPGVYEYTLRELSPPDCRWKTDRRVYRVIVKVTRDGRGGLTARIHYPDGYPEFVNVCRCCCCCGNNDNERRRGYGGN